MCLSMKNTWEFNESRLKKYNEIPNSNDFRSGELRQSEKVPSKKWYTSVVVHAEVGLQVGLIYGLADSSVAEYSFRVVLR